MDFWFNTKLLVGKLSTTDNQLTPGKWTTSTEH